MRGEVAEDAATLCRRGEGAVALQPLDAKRSSKSLALVPSFDAAAPGDWCELVRDVVALANSGGGTIVIPAAGDLSASLHANDDEPSTHMTARLTEAVARYTGIMFDGLHVETVEHDGRYALAIGVAPVPMPLVFERAGAYTDRSGIQRAAFNAGSIYVRHGSRSEPARSAEVARIIERHLRHARREWMAAVRNVVGGRGVGGTNVVQSDRVGATPIRITADPDAPEYRLVDPDVTHPWRQKELLAELNAQLAPADHINSFDMLAVRRLFDVDDNAQFVHRSKFATTQYAPAFLTWLLDQHGKVADFFRKARDEYKKRRNVGN